MPRLGGSASRGFGASGGFPGGRGSAVAILDYAAQERVMAQYLYEHAGVPTDGTNGTYAHVAPPGALLINTDAKTLYQNTNTQASPTWTERSASGGGSGLLYVDVQLNDAQIRGLPNAPVTLLAAPGADLVRVPFALWLALDLRADYTGISAGDTLELLGAGTGWATQILWTLDNLAGGVSPAKFARLWPMAPFNWVAANDVRAVGFGAPEHVNTALTMDMSTTLGTDLTDGDPDNTLSLRIWYVDVPAMPFGA